MEELGVSTFSILPSWCFGFLGKFGEGTEGDLEESKGRKLEASAMAVPCPLGSAFKPGLSHMSPA